MYVSRLNFLTTPGRTHDVEELLKNLLRMVEAAGGAHPRVMRTHYASLGAPDLVFEQEAPDLATLEEQIAQISSSDEFRSWSKKVSGLLVQSPKREVYLVSG